MTIAVKTFGNFYFVVVGTRNGAIQIQVNRLSGEPVDIHLHSGFLLSEACAADYVQVWPSNQHQSTAKEQTDEANRESGA